MVFDLRAAGSGLAPRQFVDVATATSSAHRFCTPFTLPSNGVLSWGDNAITLTTDVRFVPECTGAPTQDISLASAMKDPFYSSTIPQAYVIAATTVIAWILVTMLVITPRTNFLGPPTASTGIGSRTHGIIGGSRGGTANLIGVGSRPWLQKAAAFSVAVALTIATADMFRQAEEQYNDGYMDANRLRKFVLGSLEIRITRVLSDIVVWLAQVQTLVRLFPRHKEKVLIKWIGFCLIIFDTIFSSVDAFYVKEGTPTRPRRFVNAIPALSYLFELALGLLYAAWVLYYSITKRRYAFWHPKMRSICLISILSVVAVCTPVVFFVIDVSNQDIAGWGDYFRWVGAAAASVVVWEWVERIEALERDEKKDGILGREVFDGDEMLDLMPTDQIVWNNSSRARRFRRGGGGGGGSSAPGGTSSSDVEDTFFSRKFRRKQKEDLKSYAQDPHSSRTGSTSMETEQHGVNHTRVSFAEQNRPNGRENEVPAVPAPVASPINRADTSSAGSTVYVIKYDPLADAPQTVRRRVDANGNGEQARAQIAVQRQRAARNPGGEAIVEEDELAASFREQSRWHTVANPFKRKRASPPTEVQKAKEAAAAAGEASQPNLSTSKWGLKGRIGALAGRSGDRTRESGISNNDVAGPPVIVIPAQRRASLHPGAGGLPGRSRDVTPQRSRGSSNTATAQSTPERSGNEGTSRANNTLAPGVNTAYRVETPTPVGGVSGAASPSRSETLPNGARQGQNNLRRATTFSSPPRADDISPAASGSGPTVIPAPRRSPAKNFTSSNDGLSSANGRSSQNG